MKLACARIVPAPSFPWSVRKKHPAHAKTRGNYFNPASVRI